MLKFKIITIGLATAAASISTFAQRAPEPRALEPRAARSDQREAKIDEREARQQARIREGVRSGELNRRERERLEAEQAAIRRAEVNAKADGVVTRREAQQIGRMQDKAGRDIQRQKNDRDTRGQGSNRAQR